MVRLMVLIVEKHYGGSSVGSRQFPLWPEINSRFTGKCVPGSASAGDFVLLDDVEKIRLQMMTLICKLVLLSLNTTHKSKEVVSDFLSLVPGSTFLMR